MANLIQGIIILLILTSPVYASAPGVQTASAEKQVAREIPDYFSFILGTDGILNVFPNVKPMEHPAFTNIKTRIKGLALMLSAMGKTVETRDVLDDLWTHSYDPDWLWSSTYMDFVLAGNGVFMASGHSSPYRYTVYRFGGIWAFSFVDFPPWWARWGSSVDILASDVGGFTRNMPVEALPSLVIMYGCNTGGYNNVPYNGFENTWPWAYKFHTDDFQTSWRSRGFIGFLTSISFNSVDEPPSLTFVRRVIEYGVDDYYLGAAVILSSYEVDYSVLLDLYCNGRHWRLWINRSSEPMERAVYIGDYFAGIDPDEEDEVVSTAYSFLEKWFPELYRYIVSNGIEPSVDTINEGNGYRRYSVMWKGKDIDVSVIVVRLYGKHYAIGVMAGTGLRADEEPDKASRDLVRRVEAEIEEFMDNVAGKALDMGFSINVSGDKGSSTAPGESATYSVHYNGTPIVVYAGKYLGYISGDKHYLELDNTSMAWFETWIPLLIDVMEEKGFIQSQWGISSREAAEKVVEIIGADMRLSSLRGLPARDIEGGVRRVFIVTENGLLPGYLARIRGGGTELIVLINGIDGGILKYDVLYTMNGYSGGGTVLQPHHVIVVATVAATAMLLVAIARRKRYK